MNGSSKVTVTRTLEPAFLICTMRARRSAPCAPGASTGASSTHTTCAGGGAVLDPIWLASQSHLSSGYRSPTSPAVRLRSFTGSPPLLLGDSGSSGWHLEMGCKKEAMKVGGSSRSQRVAHVARRRPGGRGHHPAELDFAICRLSRPPSTNLALLRPCETPARLLARQGAPGAASSSV